MYEYKAIVDRVVDGDTIKCTIDLGFSTWKKVTVRMEGINTPESRTRDLEEKKLGLAAKARLIEMLECNDNKCVLKVSGLGKFGRALATVYVDTLSSLAESSSLTEININQQLIKDMSIEDLKAWLIGKGVVVSKPVSETSKSRATSSSLSNTTSSSSRRSSSRSSSRISSRRSTTKNSTTSSSSSNVTSSSNENERDALYSQVLYVLKHPYPCTMHATTGCGSRYTTNNGYTCQPCIPIKNQQFVSNMSAEALQAWLIANGEVVLTPLPSSESSTTATLSSNVTSSSNGKGSGWTIWRNTKRFRSLTSQNGFQKLPRYIRPGQQPPTMTVHRHSPKQDIVIKTPHEVMYPRQRKVNLKGVGNDDVPVIPQEHRTPINLIRILL